jgi:hypothetical protein
MIFIYGDFLIAMMSENPMKNNKLCLILDMIKIKILELTLKK